MEIKVGDRFVRDTHFGRISYNVVEIKYSWGRYWWNLEETIVYKGEGPTGTCTGRVTWDQTLIRHHFESMIRRFNARRIPRGEIGGIMNYIPRHKFL